MTVMYDGEFGQCEIYLHVRGRFGVYGLTRFVSYVKNVSRKIILNIVKCVQAN